MPLLLQGTAMVLRESFVPHQLPADARRFGARVLPGVPFMFEYFLAIPPPGGWPAALHALISAGAPPAAGHRPRLPRSLRREDPFVLRRQRDRRHRLRRQRRRSTRAGRSARRCRASRSRCADEARRRTEPGGFTCRSAAVANGYSDGPDDGVRRRGFLTGDYGVLGRPRPADARRPGVVVRQRRRPESPARGSGAGAASDAGRRRRPCASAAPDPRRGQQIVACVVAERARQRRRDGGPPVLRRCGWRRTRSRGRSFSSKPSR